MPSTSIRCRKISLQNDYAYCIISPVSPSVVPIQIVPVNAPLQNFPTEEDPLLDLERKRQDVELAEEAFMSLETNCASRSFRRWSFCNFQVSQIPISPHVTEATAIEFGNNDGYGFKLLGNPDKPNSSGPSSTTSSSTSLNWFSGIVSNIPERIRKLSTEKNKFDASNTDVRVQMKKLVVY